MYKLLILPVIAYVQAWFEVLQQAYGWAIILGLLAFSLWLAILDTMELLRD